MRKVNSDKIIVIVGTTASGKTGLGVRLAHKFNGEIISADSRQVYRGMDVGTGKDLADYRLRITNYELRITNKREKDRKSEIGNRKFVNIPYHLIDIVDPKTEFNLGKWLKYARRAVDDILARGKTPIVAGGTGLYAQALVDNFSPPAVRPDKKLRAKLEKLSVKALFIRLRKLDRKFADGLNESDKKNKRRLIRYVEVKCQMSNVKCQNIKDEYEYLIIGLTWPKEKLQKRIYKRLIERLEKEDMVGEVERLHKEGVSWKRIESFGLEYKYVSLYLRHRLDYDEMAERLFRAICQFARRQMSWLRRWERQGAEIRWVRDGKEAVKLANGFLKE